MIRLKLATREQETFEAAFRVQAEAYSRLRPDVEVEVVTRPIHDHYMGLVHGDLAAAEGVDLLLCCTDWLPEAVESGRLLPIDRFIEANPPLDWPHGWNPAMLGLQQVDGRVYGFAWHDGPEVFHYRKDLFEDRAEKATFFNRYGRELRPPETWDEFLEVARFFTRPEIGLWGCCEAAFPDGHNNVYDFLIQLWSRGGALFDEAWQPRFHQAPGPEALQFYVDLFHKHKVVSPECLNLGSVECGDYYAQGHAAMMWNWCGFAAVAEMPEYSRIVGKNACTLLPGGGGGSGPRVSLNIYWVLGVLASSRQVEEAYKFMQFLTCPEMDKATSMCGANGVRLSTWRDDEVLARYPYYGIIEDVHAGTRTLPAIPEFGILNEELSKAVERAVQGLEDPALVLDEAAEACRVILRASGRIR